MSDSTVEYPFSDEGLLDALAALGSTADEVAETLRLLGIYGTRRECSICPGANFLARYVYPDAHQILVGEAVAATVRVERWIVVPEDYGHIQHVFERAEATMPAPFLDFITAFDDEDAHHYSFLEA